MLKQKDVPQSISGRDDLHNVVVVTEAQASLTKRQSQAEGERKKKERKILEQGSEEEEE